MPKDPKSKLVGIFVIAFTFAFYGVVAQVQQPSKMIKIGEMLFRDRTDLGAGRQVFPWSAP